MATTSPRPLGARSRRRWLLGTIIALVAAAAVLIGSAFSPGGLLGRSRGPFAVRVLAGHGLRPDPLGTRLTKVYGTSIPARAYGTQIGDQEDQGFSSNGQMTSDLSPIPASAFDGPVAAYKRYAAAWLVSVSRHAASLTRALRAGDRPAARTAWAATWVAYLHLGAVYGLFGTLDRAIDGTPGGLAGGSSSPHFTGLHRIEMGLWDGAAVHSLVRVSVSLQANIERLVRVLPDTAITPLEYATRAHEILEDAQRDLLSGIDVPWSGEGVLGTTAGLAATNEVVRTLSGLLGGRDNAQIAVQNNLQIFGQALARVRREHRGAWPTLSELTLAQRELINGTLDGALSALEMLPGTLETKPLFVIPRIPGGGGH